MARAKKLWRPLKAWHRHEWVPFATAWARAEPIAGPGSHTQNELQRAFRSGQLVAAVQLIAEDGAETWVLLECGCWRWLQVNHAWSISGWRLLPGWWKAEGGPEDRERGRRHVVVHRRELDKHYPAAETVPSESSPSEGRTALPHRTPGRQPKHDWPKHMRREVIRRLRAGERDPTAPEMLQWCEDKWGWQPEVRQMQRLLRDLLS
jgi:hypothetical protein